jgi:hypothetical protein
MGTGSSQSESDKSEKRFDRGFFLLFEFSSLESNDKVKRSRNDPQTTHIEYDSLEKYGYHFKSKD